MALTRVATLVELPPGTMLTVEVNGREIVLCNHAGRVHAFDNRCPHRNGPLSQGNFVDGRLICPWHAWEFLVEKGCLDYNSAIALERFPVVLEDGAVFVDA